MERCTVYPAIASWMGVSVAVVPVRHHSRKYGKSKYGISRTIKVILDIMTVKFFKLFTKATDIWTSGLIFIYSWFYPDSLFDYKRVFFKVLLSDRPLYSITFMIFIGIQLT